MSVIVDRHGAGGHVERRRGDSSLADVVDLILDKGMIIDIFVRVSLLGLEILTIDIRIVVASVDTFLQFAEATNRLDLYSREKRHTSLPEVAHALTGEGDEADGEE
jgi:gas vesicle structural protein